MVFQLGPLPGLNSLPPGSFSSLGSPQAVTQATNNSPNAVNAPVSTQTATYAPFDIWSYIGLPDPFALGTQAGQSLNAAQQGLVNPIASLSSGLSAFTSPNAPALLSPNELFDPLYWVALEQTAAQVANPGLINTMVSTADVALLAQKYGPGGPSNYRTLLIKFGTEILFGLIFLILIYAFVSQKD